MCAAGVPKCRPYLKRSKIDTASKSQKPKNDTLFKGKAITQSFFNWSTVISFFYVYENNGEWF